MLMKFFFILEKEENFVFITICIVGWEVYFKIIEIYCVEGREIDNGKDGVFEIYNIRWKGLYLWDFIGLLLKGEKADIKVECGFKKEFNRDLIY